VRRRSLVALAMTLAVAVAACGGGGGGDDTEQQSVTTTAAPVPVAPLTGLPDPDGAAQGRPALTVKVDNACDPGGVCVRPQTGLEQADVVYEEVTEGNITRFAAIYQSQVPAEVGPIRSVRSIDPDLVTPIGGIFAYSGGAQPNVEKLLQAPVNSVDESAAGDSMFRNEDLPRPHNLFGRGQALFDKGGQPVPPPALFEYLEEDSTLTGEATAAFTVGFAAPYAPTYTYDATTRTWKRDIGGVPFTTVSRAQIAPTNVIVQFTEYTGGGEGVVLGEGDAWIFSDGQLVRGRWVRPAVEQPAQYVDGFGQPIKLLPGTTWVELLPIGAPVDVLPAAPPAPPSS
jgi:hypothetical protein